MIKVEDIIKDIDNPTEQELKTIEQLVRKEIKDNHKFYANILADKLIDPDSVSDVKPRKPNRAERRYYKKKVKK